MFYLLSHLCCHMCGSGFIPAVKMGRNVADSCRTRSSAAAVSLQFISSKYDIISLGSRLFIFRIRRHRGLIPFVMIVAAPGTAAMINDTHLDLFCPHLLAHTCIAQTTLNTTTVISLSSEGN